MFGLSQTAGYAIMALACLEEADGRWILAKDVTEQTGISGPYLSKVLQALRRSGLITAKRGYRGGFKLAHPAASITLLEIVEAADGKNWEPGCLLGLGECTDEGACPLHPVWRRVKTRVANSLQRMTLAEIVRFQRPGAGGGSSLRPASVPRRTAARRTATRRRKS